MGDRVLMQCYRPDTGKFGPVVYGHWSGSDAPKIVANLAERMAGRRGDVDYASARLVQEVCLTIYSNGNSGCGVWSADHLLTADDSHGDAGCVLINVNDYTAQYMGGYLRNDGTSKSAREQADDYLYNGLSAV